jgi:PAS domain S-box-containing protein
MTPPLNARHLSALYDVLDFIHTLHEGDEDRVWARIVEKLAAVFSAEAGTYYSYLPTKHQLIPRYCLGMAAKDITTTAVDVRTGICGWVAVHREPALVEDAYADPRFLKEVDKLTGFKTRTVLALPLMSQLEMTGVIQLFNKTGGPFDADDLRLTSVVCRAAAQALRSFRLEGMVDKVTSHNASILENLGGGFVALDMHGRMILCNPSARRILGLSQDLPLNLPAEQALAEIPAMAEILMETLATRKTVKRQDLNWKKKDGTRILGYSTLLIQDPHGNISGAGITFQDITNSAKVK